VNLWKFIQSFLTTRPNYDLSKLDKPFNRAGEARQYDQNWKYLMDSSKQWKELKKETIYLALSPKSCRKYLENENFQGRVDSTITLPGIQLGFSDLSSYPPHLRVANYGFFSCLSENETLKFRNICLNGSMSFDCISIPSETLSLELEYFGTNFVLFGDNQDKFYNNALLFLASDTLQRLSLSFSGPLVNLLGINFSNLKELVLECVTEFDPEIEYDSSISASSFWDSTTFPKLERLEISWLDNLSCQKILKLTDGGIHLKEIKLSQYSLLTEEDLVIFKNIPFVSIVSCDNVTDIHCLTNIQKLEFHDNFTLSSFHCELFPFLKELILSSCERLMELKITGLSLKKVTLKDCYQLLKIICKRNLIFLYLIFCEKVQEINLSKDVIIGVLEIIQPNDLIFPDIMINISDNSKICCIDKKNEYFLNKR
jgi:hypothetical protein